MSKRLVFAVIMALFAASVWAAPPSVTIVYQPMAGNGFAAGFPFEAWVFFDRSPDPAVPGYAFPEGATFRFRFPSAFVPQTELVPQAALLSGGPGGPIRAPFTVSLDPLDPLTIVLKLVAPLPADPPDRPGLKAIHLRSGPLNPSQPGDYLITMECSDAGQLSGSIQAIARITPKAAADMAAYNIRNQ